MKHPLFFGVFAVLGVAASGPVSADLVNDCYQATLVQTDNNDQIIAICTRAIGSGIKGKTLAIARNNRGIGHMQKGDLDLAMADFDAAIRADPEYTYAYDNRGAVWHERGQYDLAILDYNTAIRLDPSFLSAYLGRASAFEKMGNRQSARADYGLVLNAQGKGRAIDDWAKKRARERLDRLGND
jgi:tetratricopeptide (TPR) repeat protein